MTIKARGPHIKLWLEHQVAAERPFATFGDAVPSADVDLDIARTRRVVPPEGPREDPGTREDFAVKARNLARDFAGQSEILLINAKLVALSRRRAMPDHVPALFQRLWREHHAFLVERLDARWLLSSALTMADLGETETQRLVAAQLSTLLSMLKLYETERLFSGKLPDEVFPPGRARPECLALGFEPFAILGGDLDRALITGIWRRSEADPVAHELARALIEPLLADDRGLFRRLRKMRIRRQAQVKQARVRRS